VALKHGATLSTHPSPPPNKTSMKLTGVDLQDVVFWRQHKVPPADGEGDGGEVLDLWGGE
jgi:hypothetical protein